VLSLELHSSEKENLSPEPFDWTIDNFEPTEPLLKELIANEATNK